MRKYELVLVIDAALPSKEIKALKKRAEDLVNVVETDDMGLLPTAYPVRGQDQAYYVSYYIEADNEQLEAARKKLRLEEGLARHVFYAMKESDKFLTYSGLQKRYMDIKEAEEAEKEKRKEERESQQEEEKEEATS